MISEGFKSQYNEKFICRDTFESTKEMANYLKNARTNNVFMGETLSSKKEMDPGFNDFETFESAVKGLEYGCDIYFLKFEKSLQKAKDFIAKRKVNKTGNFKNDIVGFIPIVPNAIIGNPINMINQNIKAKKVPTIKLMIEKGMSFFVNSDDSIKYYSIIFALVEILEQKGIRCEIWCCETSNQSDEIYAFKLRLKDYQQPINTYKLQFPIISSDMCRRIGFRLLETCNGITDRGWRFGYGHPLNCESDYEVKNGVINDKFKEVLDLTEDDVYIPSLQHLNCHGSGKDFDYILNKLLKHTGLKKYLEII